MPRGKRNTYDCYRLTAGLAVLEVEDVSRKTLVEEYGIENMQITYAAKTQRPVSGKLGKYRIRIHTDRKSKEEIKTPSIRHVTALKTSSGCRFGG